MDSEGEREAGAEPVAATTGAVPIAPPRRSLPPAVWVPGLITLVLATLVAAARL